MTRPRRRSSIIPEILYGDSNGVGELRIGARYEPKKGKEPLMSWDYLQKVVCSDDLDNLIREPECEEEYIQWAKGIKAHYGGLENYISQERLGWDKKDLPLVESNANSTEFLDDEIMKDLSNIKVVFNDWPYGIPQDCKHHVVWCKYPIISPALLDSKDSPFPDERIREILYKTITADGIRGESGNVTKRLPVIGDKSTKIIEESLTSQEIEKCLSIASPSSQLGPTGLGPAADLAELVHLWSGRFAKKFICQYWNPKDYETVFFCNPLHLRTVPGISHFHVISRKKQSGEQ